MYHTYCMHIKLKAQKCRLRGKYRRQRLKNLMRLIQINCYLFVEYNLHFRKTKQQYYKGPNSLSWYMTYMYTTNGNYSITSLHLRMVRELSKILILITTLPQCWCVL